jgi:hypothetical protein
MVVPQQIQNHAKWRCIFGPRNQGYLRGPPSKKAWLGNPGVATSNSWPMMTRADLFGLLLHPWNSARNTQGVFDFPCFHPPIFGKLHLRHQANQSLLLRSTTLKSNQSNWSFSIFSGPDSPPLESLENEHPSFKTSGQGSNAGQGAQPLVHCKFGLLGHLTFVTVSSRGFGKRSQKKSPKGRSHFNISLSSRRTGKSCVLTWFFIIWKNGCFIKIIKTHQWI